MIKEAIILAGGLGTRLHSVISELPKCMAPVAGKPFLSRVIAYLQQQGIENFIFSVGYKNEIIIDFINTQFSTINTQFSIEEEPLGTGGAIKFACNKATEKTVLIVNGDTLFTVDLHKLAAFHNMCGADCTLSLKPMQNFDRYGVVELNKDYSIKSFNEKKFYETGLINGGIYALHAPKFLNENLPEKFSFEKEYLEKYFDKRRMYGVVQDKYFIDIGIPEDYERAQKELTPPTPKGAYHFSTGSTNAIIIIEMIRLQSIDQSWTLFLDRDGVINDEKHLEYVNTWDEFTLYPGALQAIKIFSQKFGRIFIVTNQRGVAKGLTRLEDLELIHKNLLQSIEEAEGKIDKIYFCSDMEDTSQNRKPNTGMGLQAKKDFPEVEFSKSVMIGNTLSDMEFGRNLGVALTIFLPTTRPDVPIPNPLIDLVFPDLQSVAKTLSL